MRVLGLSGTWPLISYYSLPPFRNHSVDLPPMLHRSKNWVQFDYDAYAKVEKWWMGDGRELIEIIAGERGDNTNQDSSQDDGEERIVNESHGTSFRSLFPVLVH